MGTKSQDASPHGKRETLAEPQEIRSGRKEAQKNQLTCRKKKKRPPHGQKGSEFQGDLKGQEKARR